MIHTFEHSPASDVYSFKSVCIKCGMTIYYPGAKQIIYNVECKEEDQIIYKLSRKRWEWSDRN